MSDLHALALAGNVPGMDQAVTAGADVTATDGHGNTPLHLAAAKGHFHAVAWLVQQGTPVDAANPTSQTPLHFAARYGHAEVVRWLLEQGANGARKDMQGRSPADLARQFGHDKATAWFDHFEKNPPAPVQTGSPGRLLGSDYEEAPPAMSIDGVPLGEMPQPPEIPRHQHHLEHYSAEPLRYPQNPGVAAALSEAMHALKGQFLKTYFYCLLPVLPLLLPSFLMGLLAGAGAPATPNPAAISAVGLLSLPIFLAYLLLAGPLSVGFWHGLLQGYDTTELRFGHLFSGLRRFGSSTLVFWGSLVLTGIAMAVVGGAILAVLGGGASLMNTLQQIGQQSQAAGAHNTQALRQILSLGVAVVAAYFGAMVVGGGMFWAGQIAMLHLADTYEHPAGEALSQGFSLAAQSLGRVMGYILLSFVLNLALMMVLGLLMVPLTLATHALPRPIGAAVGMVPSLLSMGLMPIMTMWFVVLYRGSLGRMNGEL